jgi:hypothetical protein
MEGGLGAGARPAIAFCGTFREAHAWHGPCSGRRAMNPSFLFVTSFILVGLVACGGSSSSGTSTESKGTAGSSCEAAGTRLCERACACATDGKCHLAVSSDGGPAASLDFDNPQKCLDLYVGFGCAGGGSATQDYGKCEADVAVAACVPAAGGTAVNVPDACKSR